MANNNLNYILGGGPIEEFNSVGEPTNGDVLRFYSKFWGVNESDASKEARVTNALKRFYTHRNIETLSEVTIRRKIHNHILSLKKVLKFKSKEKIEANIRMENAFKTQLSSIFQIRKSMTKSRDVNNVASMDIDERNIDADSAVGNKNV